MPRPLTILDGPLGTELAARGVPTPLPGWSAHALTTAPETVEAVHSDYLAAGAHILRTNTFRTRRRTFPDDWSDLARRAVRFARIATTGRATACCPRIAGSVAPLEDCFRPDLSPANHDAARTREEHAELARVLAESGCDLLICETFPHTHEALLALEACLGTGLPTWVSFTAGPASNLLTPSQVQRAAVHAARLGAAAVLVNCIPAARTHAFVECLAGAGIPFGAYANAGSPDDRMGWTNPAEDRDAPRRYADAAESWLRAGATIIGSCCGTGPAHIAELSRRFDGEITATKPAPGST